MTVKAPHCYAPGAFFTVRVTKALTAKVLAEELKESLGLSTILTLPGRLNADETGGHVDNLACFVRPGEVVMAMTQDASHPDYATCRRVYDYLQEARDAQGRPLKIHTLPLPRSPRLSAAEGASIETPPWNSQTYCRYGLDGDLRELFTG